MELIQNDLNEKVNTTIQDALSNLSRAEISGMLETEEDVEKLRLDMLDNMDRSVADVTELSLQKTKLLLNEYSSIAKARKDRAV